jgi:hypothetical protein
MQFRNTLYHAKDMGFTYLVKEIKVYGRRVLILVLNKEIE